MEQQNLKHTEKYTINGQDIFLNNKKKLSNSKKSIIKRSRWK